MNTGKTLFAQLIDFLPWSTFARYATRYDGDRYVKPLDAAFKEWLQQHPDKTEPVIFVASAGGASRAAYWATTTLGLLEDEAHQQGRRFADNIFAISGVSGGSVGAAAFVAALDTTRHAACPECDSVRKLGNAFTGKNHLATEVGFMLYPDLVQRFLPVAINK